MEGTSQKGHPGWNFKVVYQLPGEASLAMLGHLNIFYICAALASEKPQHSRVALKGAGVGLRQIWA